MCARPFTVGVSVTLLLVTWSCGSQPVSTGAPPQIGARSRVETNVAPQFPPGAGTPARTPDVVAALQGLSRVQREAGGFIAMLETVDKGPKGTDSQTVRLHFKKPSTHFSEVLRGEGVKQGIKVMWRGGETAKLKPTFLPFPVDKSLNDDALKSQNGWTFKETDVPSIFRSALDPAAQIRSLGVQSPAGKPLTMIEIRSTSMAPGVTHEVLGVDPQTGMPGARLLYKGQTLMWRMFIKSMVLRTPTEAEMSL